MIQNVIKISAIQHVQGQCPGPAFNELNDTDRRDLMNELLNTRLTPSRHQVMLVTDTDTPSVCHKLDKSQRQSQSQTQRLTKHAMQSLPPKTLSKSQKNI